MTACDFDFLLFAGLFVSQKSLVYSKMEASRIVVYQLIFQHWCLIIKLF